MKKSVLWVILLVLLCGCKTPVDSGENTEVVSPKITIMEQIPTVITPVPEITGEPPELTSTPIPETTSIPTPTPTPTPTPVPDTESPIFEGLCDKEVYVGETVSYKKGVSVSDNVDEEVSMEIDASAVNLDVPGEYPVVYSATDLAGNNTTETIQ